MSSTCAHDGPPEVGGEDFPHIIPGVDGVLLEASQPCELRWLQDHREVDDLRDVVTNCDFYALGVDPETFLGRGLDDIHVEAY